MDQVQVQKQPKVFYLAFLSSMGERFGYYIVSFLLVLYLKYVYEFQDTSAFELVGIFVAFSYIVPAIGGFLADRVIGIRRCLGLGLLIEMCGFIVLSLPGRDLNKFYLALSLIVIGGGMFKTSPTNLLGRGYEKNDPRIDGGFTLFYMGINIGGFLSSLIAGPVKDAYGWNIPFMIAAVGTFIGFIWFVLLRRHGEELESEPGKRAFSLMKWAIVIACCIVGVFINTLLFKYLFLSNYCIFLLSVIVLLYLIYEIIISPSSERWGIIVAVILIGLNIATFVLYFQLYESIELFIERNVSRAIFGVNISTPVYLGFNGLFVIILSPILASIYKALAKKKKDLNIITKMPLGLLILSSCFLILSISTLFPGADCKVSGLWLMIVILIYTLGELLTSALGSAMITKIVPVRMYGVMTGAWFFLGVGLPGKLSANVANLAKIPDSLANNLQGSLAIYAKAFMLMGVGGICVAIFGFIIAPWLKHKAKLS